MYRNMWRVIPYTSQRDIEEGDSSRPSTPQNACVLWWKTRRWQIFISALSLVAAVVFTALAIISIINGVHHWITYAFEVVYIVCSVVSLMVFIYTVGELWSNTAILPVTALPVNDAILQNIGSEFGRYTSEQAINPAPGRRTEVLSRSLPCYLLMPMATAEENTLPTESNLSTESCPEGEPEQEKAKLQYHSEKDGLLQPSATGDPSASVKVLNVASEIARISTDAIKESRCKPRDVETSSETSSDITPDKDEVKGVVRQRKVSPTPPQPVVTLPEEEEKE